MKRGLKRSCNLLRGAEPRKVAVTCPDEEGIETRAWMTTANHDRVVAVTCPDEEGIETWFSRTNLRFVYHNVAVTCPDEEGIETLLMHHATALRKVAVTCPDEEGIETKSFL